MNSARRQFLERSLTAGAASLLASTAFANQAADQKKRPNILFCIGDDWGFGHAGAYGDKVVQTPAFDRIAREGALFTQSFCIAPTCTPSRAGILTGQPPHRLENSANLWSTLPPKFDVYPDLLESAGYVVGLTGKGFGPGAVGQRKRNPAGPNFRNFDQFLATVPADKPFCYWFGGTDPHRAYDPGLKEQLGLANKRDQVIVPPFLPDTPEVRDDILDYYAEVQRFDTRVGELLDAIEKSGRAQNTLVVMTSDNGMPFPKAKANLYDAGARMPLAMRFPGQLKGGRVCESFVSHLDFAPTFLQAAGLKPTADMRGISLFDLLNDEKKHAREFIFFERERHANVRAGSVGYPARAVRDSRHLYIRNFAPDRWPAGDPDFAGVMGRFGDVDSGPSKNVILTRKDEPGIKPLFDAAFAKRPPEELYDIQADPAQMKNLIADPNLAQTLARLRDRLAAWMKETADPRSSNPATDEFDKYPYLGRDPRPPSRQP